MRNLELNMDEYLAILSIISALDELTLTDSGNIFERIPARLCNKESSFFVSGDDLVQLQIIKNKLNSKKQSK